MKGPKVIGVTRDGIKVHDASAIGGHTHMSAQKTRRAIAKVTLGNKTFVSTAVHFGDKHFAKNALTKRIDGDHIVMWERPLDDANPARRRAGKSPMIINRKMDKCGRVVVVLCVATDPGYEGKAVLVTCYGGNDGLREPFDRSLKTPEAVAASEEYWSEYALIASAAQKKQMRKDGVI